MDMLINLIVIIIAQYVKISQNITLYTLKTYFYLSIIPQEHCEGEKSREMGTEQKSKVRLYHTGMEVKEQFLGDIR